MTVDESQMSATSASSGTAKAKATIVNSSSASSGPKSPRNGGSGQFQQPDNRVQSPKGNSGMDAMSENNINSFEHFAQSNPAKAEELMGKLTEVTGMTERAILYKAFDQSRKSDPNQTFNVTHAIEWILQLSDCNSAAMPPTSNMDQQRTRRKTPVQPQFVSPAPPPPAVAQASSPAATNAVNNHSYAPMQPPNSPSAVASGGGDVLRPNSKPLVDLTDSSNDGNTGKDTDADLEKAIQLSLQDVKRTEGGNIGVSQEEQDVSRALEASLMENQFGGKRTRGIIDYVDPLNPHDRERNGMVRIIFCSLKKIKKIANSGLAKFS